ncbi:MAG: hypothetical protein CFE36_06455 [Sphingomonadaceae bacterium PASS1]|nr:MAG: hypothetical protein CFE36_06455 [Sphingomonadaceae bacterium PASS1]
MADLFVALGRDAWFGLLLWVAVPCADPLELLFIDFFCVSELAMMFGFLVTWVRSMHVNKSAEASFLSTPSNKGN